MKHRTRTVGSKSSREGEQPEVVIAPEGVEFSITTYVRSDSTNLEIVHVSDGLSSLPLSDLLEVSDATTLVRVERCELALGAHRLAIHDPRRDRRTKAAKIENGDLDEPNP